MRIGIFENDDFALKRLISWLDQYCRLCNVYPEISGFRGLDDLIRAMKLRRFDIVYISSDGVEGLLSARRVRELDKTVKLVLISDTDQHALISIRLHMTDYIIKPVEFKHIVRSLKLAGLD